MFFKTKIDEASALHPISREIKRKLGKSRVQPNALGRSFYAPLPASPEAVDACERALGIRLPPILREIYLHVANGGFGPGYAVTGVEGGFTDGRGTLVELTREFKRWEQDDPTWQWAGTWLPFCNWGCGVYSVVDCVEPYPVFYLDSDIKGDDAPMSSIIRPHKPSLSVWLEDWLSGKNLWNEVFR